MALHIWGLLYLEPGVLSCAYCFVMDALVRCCLAPGCSSSLHTWGPPRQHPRTSSFSLEDGARVLACPSWLKKLPSLCPLIASLPVQTQTNFALRFTLSHRETEPPCCPLSLRVASPSPPRQDPSPLQDHEPEGEQTRNRHGKGKDVWSVGHLHVGPGRGLLRAYPFEGETWLPGVRGGDRCRARGVQGKEVHVCPSLSQRRQW